MAIDVNGTVQAIIQAVQGVVSGRWNQASSYAQQRAKLLAQQAEQLTALRISGDLDDQSLTFELKQLETQTRGFAITLVNLAVAAVAAVFDAAIGVLWKVIGGALGGVGLGGLLPAQPSF